ncbi:hypothetical protein MC885_003795 [Smutsia gigantea]|nr:hypothetical protein MC885_003795 [Smutsia gigantea]
MYDPPLLMFANELSVLPSNFQLLQPSEATVCCTFWEVKFMSPGTEGGDITKALFTSPSGINPEPKPPVVGNSPPCTIPPTTCVDSIIM